MRKPYITPVSSCIAIDVQSAFMAGSVESTFIIDKETEIEENLTRMILDVDDFE